MILCAFYMKKENKLRKNYANILNSLTNINLRILSYFYF